MKTLYRLLLLLFFLHGEQACAAFVCVRGGSGCVVVTDSPEVRRPLVGYGSRRKAPTKQIRGVGVLSLATGLLSISGAIALLVLWPVPLGVGIVLGIGTLLTGATAILFADINDRNIKPNSLGLVGGLLGMIAILPVLLVLCVFGIIYAGISDFADRRKKRRQLRSSAN